LERTPDAFSSLLAPTVFDHPLATLEPFELAEAVGVTLGRTSDNPMGSERHTVRPAQWDDTLGQFGVEPLIAHRRANAG
jgi:hypothetical protein